VSRATIAAIEGGRYQSQDSRTVQALAAALHVAVSRLMDAKLRRLPTQPRAEVVRDFLASTWPQALRLQPSEIAWLDSLGFGFWEHVGESPLAVAELLAWRRRHDGA
jgi:hypothetical protein